MSMEELQLGAGTPKVGTVHAENGKRWAVKELTEEAAPVVPPQEQPAGNTATNAPLTDAQKYVLRSYQNKLNLLAKQKSEIDVQVARVEGAMQLDMMKIARENNIDPAKFGFNENLDIIPVQPQGPSSGMRRA